jgi:hypothetical protein
LDNCICCATFVFVFPSAQVRMTRARKDKAWAEVGRHTQRSSVSRSSLLNCNGEIGLPSVMNTSSLVH